MIDNKIFAGGKLNRDDDYHVLPKNDWVDARNVRINSTADGYLGAFSNIKGTLELDSPTPIGDNDRVIGARGFDTVNKIFYFTCDAIGDHHRIISYNASDDSFTVIVENLTDTDNVNVLNFSNGHRINHIDLLDNRFLYWTDGFNPPRMIDITKNYGVITPQSLSVIKKPPLVPISSPNSIDDPAGLYNDIGATPFQFKYRWIYWDNAKSAYSPASSYGEQRSRGNAAIDTYASKIFDSAIQFNFDGGGPLVKGAEIIGRAGDSADWQHVMSFDYSTQNYLPIFRLGMSDFAISYSVTFTINGTPTVLSGTANSAKEAMDAMSAQFDASVLPTSLRKAYIPNESGYGYMEFQVINAGDVVSIDTGTPSVVNLILVQDTIINENTENLYTFTSVANLQIADQDDANAPFDYVPLLADAQAMPNGNYLAYGNYTEGFNNVNVDFSVGLYEDYQEKSTYSVNMTNGSAGGGENFVQFNFSGTIEDGDVLLYQRTTGNKYYKSIPKFDNEVEADFISRFGRELANIEANGTTLRVVVDTGAKTVRLIYPAGGELVFFESVMLSRNTKRWFKGGSKYNVGIVYIDEYGRFGAVNTIAGSTFNIPQFQDFSFQIYNLAPQLNIKSLAPDWADKYAIVVSKSNLTGRFLQLPLDEGYVFNPVGTISILKTPISDYNIDFAASLDMTFEAGDDVLFMNDDGTVFTTTFKEYDDDENFVVYTNGLTQQTITNFNFTRVELRKRVVTTDQLYYQIAKIGNIVDGYHQGIGAGDTNQISGVDARIRIDNGDVLLRNVWVESAPSAFRESEWMEFYSFSDYTNDLLATSIGTPNAVNAAEQQTTYPATVRFSGAYVPGTQTNNVNRFLATSIKDYSETYGPIQKLDVDGSMLILGHQLRIGLVRIFETMLVDKAGQELVGTSERLLSDSSYYDYEAGIGDSPESYMRWGSTKYFVDKRRGLVCRLAKNGVTPISITAKMNSYFNSILPGAINVVGGFDPENQEYVVTITKTGLSDSVIFSENSNGFTSFIDILPTCYATLGQALYSFELIKTYKMNASADYNTFYSNPAEPSSVTIVSNEAPLIKKSFIAMSEVASELWSVPEIETDLGQESKLNANRFATLEGEFHASFMRDSRVTPGVEFPLINGNRLKGKWIKMKLQNSSTDFVYLLSVGVKSAVSPQTGV